MRSTGSYRPTRLSGAMAVVAGASVLGWFALGPSPQCWRRPAAAAERAPEVPIRREAQRRVVVAQFRGGRLPAEFSAEAEVSGGTLILADRKEIQRLRVATEMLERGEHENAIDLLQRVLGTPEETPPDGFFHPDTEDRQAFRSLKAEALRLIEALPPEGKQVYERRFGPPAQALLDEAIRDGDIGKVGDVARLFLHTPAGAEAAYRLGQHYLDGGQPLAAALWFERLRKRPEAARRWEPALSLETAACLSRAGLTDEASEILAGLARNGAALTAGGNAVPLQELSREGAAWLAGGDAGGPAAGINGWTLQRGQASRNAVVRAAGAPADVTWRLDTNVDVTKFPGTGESKLDELLRSATRDLASNERGSWAALPKRHPLVVNGRVVARSLCHTFILDFDTGKALQETFEETGGSRLMERAGDALNGEAVTLPNMEQYVRDLVRQRVWEDATFGTMSSDGELVYCVEETGIGGSVAESGHLFQEIGPKPYNMLIAYDLQTGMRVWELGGPPAAAHDSPAGPFELPMMGTYFLGAPLPLGGQLYCLAEIDHEIRLVVLQPRGESPDGQARRSVETVWQQPVATVPVIVGEQPGGWSRRRYTGTTISYADGIMICPTEAGAVVAVDVTTRSLLWAYGTESAWADAVPAFPGGPVPGQHYTGRAHASDPLATIADGRVLLLPQGTDKLVCLDLHDGTLLWEQERDGIVMVGGVAGGTAVLVAEDEVRAVTLENGRPAWDQPIEIAHPSGQGFIAGNFLYLPLASAKVAVIDVRTGEVVIEAPTPDNIIPGNLAHHDGAIVSQGTESVDVFPMPALPPDAGESVSAAAE